MVIHICKHVKIHRPVCQKKKKIILLYNNLKNKMKKRDTCSTIGEEMNKLWYDGTLVSNKRNGLLINTRREVNLESM